MCEYRAQAHAALQQQRAAATPVPHPPADQQREPAVEFDDDDRACASSEFADATTRVTWVVANNRCDIKGDAEWEKYAAEIELIQAQEADTRTDAFGNTTKVVKIKTIAEMSRAEVKKNKKLINSKIKNGEELEEHEMDWADEWNIKFDY